MSFKTPILVLVFNRPDYVVQLLDCLSRVRPAVLYVAADGPRAGRPGEEQACHECLDLFANLSWPCQVIYLKREKNLGCRKAVSSAISWFFEQVPAGIILEDDCLPSDSFFKFCEELLIRYQDHPEVMAISGDSFYSKSDQVTESYYFTKYCHIWGWATWRRAWQKYDENMRSWSNLASKDRWLLQKLKSKPIARYWKKNFDMVASGQIDTWDFQWVWSIWAAGGLCIVPKKNLVRNIGFDHRATHTQDAAQSLSLKAEELGFPLQHPTEISTLNESDLEIGNRFFRRKSYFEKLKEFFL